MTSSRYTTPHSSLKTGARSVGFQARGLPIEARSVVKCRAPLFGGRRLQAAARDIISICAEHCYIRELQPDLSLVGRSSEGIPD